MAEKHPGMAAVLASLMRSVDELKTSMVDVKNDLSKIVGRLEGDGTEANPGVLIDVDRLKRSQAMQAKVIWILVTAVAGGGATMVTRIISGH